MNRDNDLRKQERKMLTHWKQRKGKPLDPTEQAKLYRQWLRENRPDVTTVHVFPGREYLALDLMPIVVDPADYK